VRLALGTVQFGLPYGVANKSGQVSQNEAQSMLRIASENGIDTLDTAIAYGESEKCLGEVGVENFKLVTKLPAMPNGCLDINNWGHEQVSSSLVRLGVGQIYALLLHKTEDLLGPNGRKLYVALDSLKEKGLVKKIGLSIYSPNELEALKNDFSFDLVQAPFNLIDQRLLHSGWMQKLKDNGVEIHTRSAFLQGLLLMKEIDIPPKFSPWKHLWKKWHDWLDENNISALRASLAFSLSFSEIDRVVVGADSLSQLQQIFDVIKLPLIFDFPSIDCDDDCLINPSRWSGL
jgi:aryl-alcohol dehydrogenase-like predicted oxidoreductase